MDREVQTWIATIDNILTIPYMVMRRNGKSAEDFNVYAEPLMADLTEKQKTLIEKLFLMRIAMR